jgi:hypothetical protein
VLEPTVVITGTGEDDEYLVANAWHILDELIVQCQFSEPVDLDRLAMTEAEIGELPLEVRQAWGEALIEAAVLFQRKFLREKAGL